jgi:imidazolonepropionase
MDPEEAINAATLNSAYAMGVMDQLGSLMNGKRANLFITKPMPSIAYMCYAFTGDHIDKIFLNGKLQ